MIEFIDKTSTIEGTKINRKNLMGIQGFIGQTVVFNSDGTITETNEDGQTLKTIFPGDESIIETFSGDKTITKRTTFSSNGNATEVIL